MGFGLVFRDSMVAVVGSWMVLTPRRPAGNLRTQAVSNTQRQMKKTRVTELISAPVAEENEMEIKHVIVYISRPVDGGVGERVTDRFVFIPTQYFGNWERKEQPDCKFSTGRAVPA